ncbi:DUF167 domain-containing protein [Rubrimonas sp.]|uniref:DUF167 domain-containing protein n=1 Tax=Rubrimonas sp. TaxID=2036015 RepID=UPI002FDCA37C
MRPSIDPEIAALGRAARDAGGLIAIRVIPGASADAVALDRTPEGAPLLRVRVTAPPAEGAANAAVLKLLARAFGAPKSALSIERGASGRDKLVRLAR